MNIDPRIKASVISAGAELVTTHPLDYMKTIIQNKESKIKTNKENFCFAPLCKRAERITIPKSSRLVDIF